MASRLSKAIALDHRTRPSYSLTGGVGGVKPREPVSPLSLLRPQLPVQLENALASFNNIHRSLVVSLNPRSCPAFRYLQYEKWESLVSFPT